MDGSTMSKGSTDVGMTTTREVVTPLMAETWLKVNHKNRSPNLGRVTTIAADITAGRWKVNGDAIRFGADQTLYDGQHRLMAICKAGIAVETNVVRGLAPEARDFIDLGGGARNARDVVAITDGVSVPKMHVSWVAAAERMLRHGTLNGNHTPMSADDLRTAMRRHGTALAGLAEPLGSGNKRRLVPASAIGAFLIAWRSAPDKTFAFAQGVKTGENLTAGDPALTFRNYLIANQGDTAGSVGRDEMALRAFAALDAYVRGESLKILKANEGARERFVAAWKAREIAASAGKAPTKVDPKPAGKLSVVPPPSAPGKFADAIRASQLKETKKRTPDAPPPPVEVVPPKRSSTKMMGYIAAVLAYLRDGKTHRTKDIAAACDIPHGSINAVLTEALNVRNLGRGVWALKKSA